MKVEIAEWRDVPRNTLLGFAKVQFPEPGISFDGVAVHSKNGRGWAQLPSRPLVDSSRKLMLDDTGKIKYAKSATSTAGRPPMSSRRR